jgi:predicted dehydrogenase
MSGPIEAILIGAGQRGAKDYAPYALQHPHELRFVAVAEPIPERRLQFAQDHQIPTERQFNSWEDLLEQSQMGEAAIVCTQDQLHTQPALAAFQKGYHVLLEKPIAITPEECRLLVSTAQKLKRQLHICHVLRYTKHFQRLRELVQSGILGQIVHVDHKENVSWWHMAHSYVRGQWAVESASCPMILAKCCHDFDILLWVLDRKCLQLSSMGNLLHFRPENAPPNVPERCLDGCPAQDTCPYYAPMIYVDLLPLWRTVNATSSGLSKWLTRAQLQMPGILGVISKFVPLLRQVSDYRGWPRSVLTLDPTPESLQKALLTGPYGRCVYRCGNDVVDHQVVLMEFEGGVSVTLTMQGHAHIEGRTIQIEGSRASLQASFSLGGSWIEISDHRSGQITRYDTSTTLPSGHLGGDEGIMRSFVCSLREGKTGQITIAAQQALESHLLAFAAEEARKTGVTINMEGYA